MQTNIMFFFVFIFCINVCVCKKYYNYTLFRGIPVEEDHMEYFMNLSKIKDVNFWREPGLMYKPVDFVVGPEAKPVFQAEAERLGLYVTTLLEDVQNSAKGGGSWTIWGGTSADGKAELVFVSGPRLSALNSHRYIKLCHEPHVMPYAHFIGNDFIFLHDNAREYTAFDKQTVKTYIRRKMDTFDWNNFFRLDDIYQWLTDLAKINPIEISVQSIGKTLEKREIMAVRIALKGCKMRSKVIVEGGIHAREWISPAFVTYLIHQIIHSSTSNNEKLKEIALTYEWYFVPVLNPDGYEYSHTDDRQWRKNRNVYGVDLNRNFDFGFGTIGVSNQKASNTYCGRSAFSERETKAMKNFVTSKSKNLEYYFAFHSYGQYMIIPYANSKVHVENFEEVKQMCQQAAVLISRRYRTKYTVGTAYDTVGYMTSGVSGCWVKKTLKVPYVVTFELRDDGFYGFALPPQKIEPTCQETMDGLLHLLTPKANFTNKKVKNDKLRALKDCSGPHFILDKIVMIFNVFLFIIVRFD